MPRKKQLTKVEKPELPEEIAVSEKAKERFLAILQQVDAARRDFNATVEKYQTFVYGLAVGLDVDLENYVLDDKEVVFRRRDTLPEQENVEPEESAEETAE